MTKRAIFNAAASAAQVLTKMVAPALLPDERREFRKKAAIVCLKLLEAYQRKAGQDRMNIKSSLN